jgi:hypothetical protein
MIWEIPQVRALLVSNLVGVACGPAKKPGEPRAAVRGPFCLLFVRECLRQLGVCDRLYRVHFWVLEVSRDGFKAVVEDGLGWRGWLWVFGAQGVDRTLMVCMCDRKERRRWTWRLVWCSGC